MQRELLPHLPVVLAVARRGGFAAAAAELGLGASAVSHAVRTVEDALDTPLFARTTRSVALTEAGERLVERLAAALREIDEAAAEARPRGPSGTLRLNTPRVALPLGLSAVVARLARDHPSLTVELVCDDRLADIVTTHCDAGVRLGEMIAADMVAVRLTPPFRTVVAAAPGYLARHGRPSSLADLAAHAAIGHRLPGSGALYRWQLMAEGREVAVAVGGGPVVNDVVGARTLALEGLGLGYLFEPLIVDDVLQGRLEVVLADAALEEAGFFLYYPQRLRGTPKIAALVTAARAGLRSR